MLEILTWLETSCRLLGPAADSCGPPSREQLVWSCGARAPLGVGAALLPTTERQADDKTITMVEIRNSYAPAMPACIGKYILYLLLSRAYWERGGGGGQWQSPSAEISMRTGRDPSTAKTTHFCKGTASK